MPVDAAVDSGNVVVVVVAGVTMMDAAAGLSTLDHQIQGHLMTARAFDKLDWEDASEIAADSAPAAAGADIVAPARNDSEIDGPIC